MLVANIVEERVVLISRHAGHIRRPEKRPPGFVRQIASRAITIGTTKW
jgi:hypothetical protein